MGNLYPRIKRKIGQILMKLVPYNRSLRPVGVYNSLKEYLETTEDKGSSYYEIYAGYASTMDISQDFYKHVAAYMNLPLSGSFPKSFVVEVPKGRVYTDNLINVSIISHDNKIIGGISFQAGLQNPSANNLLTQSYFKQVKVYKGVVFQALSGLVAGNNYFHWMFDVLPRFHLLKQSGLFEKIDYFLVPRYEYSYQKETLRLLGISEEKIIRGDVETHIQADTIVTSSFVRHHTHIPAWSCEFIRESLLKKINITDTSEVNYVYISRNDSADRNVVNEAELMMMLSKYGFKKYLLSCLTFEEQVKLFNSARVVIGPHGAGFTNIVYCKKGADIIELFADGYVHTCYYDLANKSGLQYHYMIDSNKAKETKTIQQGRDQHICVDLNELEQIIVKTGISKSKETVS